MAENRNINEILKEQARNAVFQQQAPFEITPLNDIMGRIKKEKRRKTFNYVIKPALFLVALMVVACISLLFNDTPQINALKFKVFNIKYSQDGTDSTFIINGKDNYTVLENTEYNLLIEFYDEKTAEERMNSKLYFPSYIPVIYHLDKITYEEDLIGPSYVNMLFKDMNQNNLYILMQYLYEDTYIKGSTTQEIYKEVIINDIEVSLGKNSEYNIINAYFIYDDIYFILSGEITEWELLKVVKSLFE